MAANSQVWGEFAEKCFAPLLLCVAVLFGLMWHKLRGLTQQLFLAQQQRPPTQQQPVLRPYVPSPNNQVPVLQSSPNTNSAQFPPVHPETLHLLQQFVKKLLEQVEELGPAHNRAFAELREAAETARRQVEWHLERQSEGNLERHLELGTKKRGKQKG